jgi:DNA-binding Xre family transcriptional regulator
MSDLHRKLARKLIQIRGDKSRRQFAKELGLSHTTLNRLEEGNQNTTLETLNLLCKKLKCNVGDLFE